MDGSNISWRVFEIMFEYLKQEGNINLFNMESCELYVLHNAFSAGCGVFSEVKETASALNHLFKGSPAPRDDFLNIDINAKFLPKFCKSRWLENVCVLTRLLDILTKVKTYTFSVKMKENPDPKNKSFEIIKDSVNGFAKCKFAIFIAKEIEPFFTFILN